MYFIRLRIKWFICKKNYFTDELKDSLNGMQLLLTGEDQYDEEFYNELVVCLESVDPRLLESVNAQWKGFKDYAATGGNPPEDEWKQCSDGYQVCFEKLYHIS